MPRKIFWRAVAAWVVFWLEGVMAAGAAKEEKVIFTQTLDDDVFNVPKNRQREFKLQKVPDAFHINYKQSKDYGILLNSHINLNQQTLLRLDPLERIVSNLLVLQSTTKP